MPLTCTQSMKKFRLKLCPLKTYLLVTVIRIELQQYDKMAMVASLEAFEAMLIVSCNVVGGRKKGARKVYYSRQSARASSTEVAHNKQPRQNASRKERKSNCLEQEEQRNAWTRAMKRRVIQRLLMILNPCPQRRKGVADRPNDPPGRLLCF